MDIDSETINALKFVRDTYITMSEWRRDGKPAYGKPEEWNEFRMAGDGKVITITSTTQAKLRDLTKVGPSRGSLRVLNAAGARALKEAA